MQPTTPPADFSPDFNIPPADFTPTFGMPSPIPGPLPSPEISKEAEVKVKQLKTKLEKFKKQLLDKYKKEVVSISVVPPSIPLQQIPGMPPAPPEELDPIKKDGISVLAIVQFDDKKNKKTTFMDFIKKFEDDMRLIAKSIDDRIEIHSRDLEELKETCFDGKYKVVRRIALSAPIYDPKDLLAALRISEVHRFLTIRKFEKYVVSYVAAGSLFRGDKKSNDIDVYVIVDDTDVKKMSRLELKDKLRAIITSLGFQAAKETGVNKQFHVQTYILTDFWESVKDAHPVIFTFLRDGVPLYDRGVFMPWKLLLKMGRVKPSSEAIDMHMDLGERLLERTRAKLLSIVSEDIYYALLNPSQAALMLYGLTPPTPAETIELMSDIFVKKEKMFEKRYVDMLARVRDFYKSIEHRKVKEISGAEVDKLLADADAYLKRIKKLFTQIQAKSDRESFDEVHASSINIASEVLEANNVKVKKSEVSKQFDQFVKDKSLPPSLSKTFNELLRAKKDSGMTKAELQRVKREARKFIRSVEEILDRKKDSELKRSKVRIIYGDKFGEITFVGDEVFLQKDVGIKGAMIQKAKLNDDGTLSSVKDSSAKEMEKAIKDAPSISKAEVNSKLLEELKKVFGKDVSLLVN